MCTTDWHRAGGDSLLKRRLPKAMPSQRRWSCPTKPAVTARPNPEQCQLSLAFARPTTKHATLTRDLSALPPSTTRPMSPATYSRQPLWLKRYIISQPQPANHNFSPVNISNMVRPTNAQVNTLHIGGSLASTRRMFGHSVAMQEHRVIVHEQINSRSRIVASCLFPASISA